MIIIIIAGSLVGLPVGGTTAIIWDFIFFASVISATMNFRVIIYNKYFYNDNRNELTLLKMINVQIFINIFFPTPFLTPKKKNTKR